MPLDGSKISCVRIQNHILLSCYDFRLMSYDVDNEAYSVVEPKEYNGAHLLLFKFLNFN